jgi:Ca2+-binding RTX toxin-like protein
MAQVIGDGNNWLIGTGSADTIYGLSGNDSLKGGGGADTLNGGDGNDTAVYADSPGQVYVDLQAGIGLFGFAQGDRLIRIENVYGSGAFDILYGSDVANTLSGVAGDDWLDGRGGADVLEGGYGSDRLTGGSGGDVLNGGEGEDIAVYRDSPAGVLVSLASGYVTGGDAGGDTLIGIESLDGSEFGDVLLGNDGANYLRGNGGNDSLKGFGGDDSLHGDAGNDQLTGGVGADFMTGAGGADTFIWSSIDDPGTTVETADRLGDFVPGEGDRLDVSGVDADAFAVDNQAFRFIGNAGFSGTPGEINYVHQNGDTIIQMQTGMSADVEGVIIIPGIVTPEASWFVL